MDGVTGGWMWRLTVVCAVFLLTGCAEWFEPPSGAMTVSPSSSMLLQRAASDDGAQLAGGVQTNLVTGSASDSSTDVIMNAAVLVALTPAAGEDIGGVESLHDVVGKGKEPAAAEDELYDPFQKPGEEAAEVEEYDPWESFNVRMFNFNYKLDKYVVKPVAEFYDKIMPDEIERGLSRGFRNIGFVPRFLNSLLQGKVKRAGIEISRFVINSSLGIGGLLDFAKEVFDLDAPPEDTGQTLGLYGVPPGPYLVLPFLPQPFTLRDGFGYAVDVLAFNPMVYFLPFTTLFPMNVGYQLNERSIYLESFQGVEEATIDLYGAVRNAYLQKRMHSIRE